MPLPLMLLGSISNFKTMGTFVANNWKFMLIAALAFGVWYQNTNEVRFVFGIQTIPHLEKQVLDLEARVKAAEDAVYQCKDGNDTLSKSIDDRNTEVKRWKKISEGLETQINVLNNEIDVLRTETNATVETVLKDETPKTCEAAIDYLREGTGDIKW